MSYPLFLQSVLALSWTFIFPWNAAILGIIVASLVGLVFGIYPARAEDASKNKGSRTSWKHISARNSSNSRRRAP